MKELYIKLDPAIKIILLTAHFIGFSYWIAAILSYQINITAVSITIVSGFLLVIRELIKDGFVWFTTTEGIFTSIKVLILLAAFLLNERSLVIFLFMILFGVLSAHLPKHIKDKKFIKFNRKNIQ